MGRINTFVKDLYCSKCDKRYSLNNLINTCSCESPLLVDYDYEMASSALKKEEIKIRKKSMWKYLELLPVLNDENIVTLGEGGTPLLSSISVGKKLGLKHIFFKDESGNPTGSFKARGLSMAVSKGKELGIKECIIPSAGNAGSALSAYCARAGINCYVIMPEDVPKSFLIDCKLYGAHVELIKGTIKDCGQRASEYVKSHGYFSMATLKEPYRIEGKKTMGYEIAEDFDYSLPDVIIYPTGGGTGLIGMWKAFNEMEKMGWIKGKKPRMISVQSEGCAPIVKAFKEGKEKADLWENPYTLAAGLRVPSAIGDFLMLKVIRESGGLAIAVSEKDIMNCTEEMASEEGIFSSPEGGAALAALKELVSSKLIDKDERVVVFITGNGLKYLDIFGI